MAVEVPQIAASPSPKLKGIRVFLLYYFPYFYLRRSHQVLELWELLLFLLWGGSSLSAKPSTMVYFGFINSLQGGIHNQQSSRFFLLHLAIWVLFGVGSQHFFLSMTQFLFRVESMIQCLQQISFFPKGISQKIIISPFLYSLSMPQVFEQSLFLFSFCFVVASETEYFTTRVSPMSHEIRPTKEKSLEFKYAGSRVLFFPPFFSSPRGVLRFLLFHLRLSRLIPGKARWVSKKEKKGGFCSCSFRVTFYNLRSCQEKIILETRTFKKLLFAIFKTDFTAKYQAFAVKTIRPTRTLHTSKTLVTNIASGKKSCSEKNLRTSQSSQPRPRVSLQRKQSTKKVRDSFGNIGDYFPT